MPLYKIVRAIGQTIDINVVTLATSGGTQGIIVYESPGSNGGFVINTGRNNKKVALSGKLTTGITQDKYVSEIEGAISLSDQITILEDIKDSGEIITLLMPICNNSVGKWVINAFTWTIPSGSAAYVDFTLELTEYRQVASQYTIQNIIGGEAVKSMQQQSVDRTAVESSGALMSVAR
jgi:hypothetical protein